jgi:hypothetical protein
MSAPTLGYCLTDLGSRGDRTARDQRGSTAGAEEACTALHGELAREGELLLQTRGAEVSDGTAIGEGASQPSGSSSAAGQHRKGSEEGRPARAACACGRRRHRWFHCWRPSPPSPAHAHRAEPAVASQSASPPVGKRTRHIATDERQPARSTALCPAHPLRSPRSSPHVLHFVVCSVDAVCHASTAGLHHGGTAETEGNTPTQRIEGKRRTRETQGRTHTHNEGSRAEGPSRTRPLEILAVTGFRTTAPF